jgi:CheY-like chemotaxis protein
MPHGKCRVLVADDSDEDRLLLKRAIAKAASRLHVVAELGNGEAVIAYLCGTGDYANRELYPYPDLGVMDWRMPRKCGNELLEMLRSDSLPRVKIAVLSDPFYRREVLASGGAWFFAKETDPDSWNRTAKGLEEKYFAGEGQD